MPRTTTTNPIKKLGALTAALADARQKSGIAADRFFVLKDGETWRMPPR